MKAIKLRIDDHYQSMEMLKALHDNGYEAEVIVEGKVKDGEGIRYVRVVVRECEVGNEEV